MHGLEFCILTVAFIHFIELMYCKGRDARDIKRSERNLSIAEQHLHMSRSNYENGQAEQRIRERKAYTDGIETGRAVELAKAVTAKKAAADEAAYVAMAAEHGKVAT